MTDIPGDDGKSDLVKKAMGKKRPVKLAVVGGTESAGADEFALYGPEAKAKKPKKPAPKSGPPPVEQDDPGAQANDGQDDAGGESQDGAWGNNRLGSLTDAERELLEHLAQYDQNDRDNARRLNALFGQDMKFVQGMGWLAWNGSHWKRDEGDLVVRLNAQDLVDWIKLERHFIKYTPEQQKLVDAAKVARKTKAEDRSPVQDEIIASAAGTARQLGSKRAAREKFAVSSGNASKTGAMLLQATSLMAVDKDVLDSDKMKFNLRNGTLLFWRELDPDQPEGGERTIGKFEFRSQHSRSDMITKVAEVDYDPDATCPYFREKFLGKLMPDPRMQTFLQVFHAYALLIGGNDEQKLVYHYGTGANGKSAFIEVIGRMAGTYRTVVSPDTITGDTQRGGQQASPDIARLHNTRLATVEELPKNVPLKEELIKALSGGTKMTARFLQKDIFEFEPIFTPVLSGNSKPMITGSDHGIWRRVLIAPWAVTIQDDEKLIPSLLAAKLDAERSGILNWLLEGIEAYLSHGLDHYTPEEVRAFTQDYREERDNVGVFAEACIVAAPGRSVQAGPLYKAYTDWCEVNGLTAAKQRSFGDRLNELGFKKDRGRIYQYLNVKLGDVPSKFDPITPAPPREATDPGWQPS